MEHWPRLTAIDGSGRYLVAGVRIDNTRGTACDANTGAWRRVGDQNIVVSRFLPDGTLDASFGSTGSVVVPSSSHTVNLSDLVVSDGAIYASAFLETGTCGAMGSSPLPPASIVVRITDSGALDGSFGQAGVWSAGRTTDEVHLAPLEGGAAAAFYDSTFAHLSGARVVETDLSETLCSGTEAIDPDQPARDCPRGARIATHGASVAMTLAWSGRGNRSMRVFFGRVRDGRLVPDYRVSQTGIDVIDVSGLLGEGRVWPGSNWLGWDSSGRLMSVLTVSEDHPTPTTFQPPGSPPGTSETALMDMPHGRGLLTARFVPDPEGGWRLDPTYAEAGMSYAPLPMGGPDSFAIGALGLDQEDRPVLAGTWWNPGVEYSANFVTRLAADGALDASYGAAGILWLPAAMPPIYGELALDNRDNQYFAAAWQAFASRAKVAAPYRLGRISSRGRIQLHDRSRWRDAPQQSRPRTTVSVLDRLPSSGPAGKQVRLRVRVTVDAEPGGKGPSTKGIEVVLGMIPASGGTKRVILARARTKANGVATLTLRLSRSGYYYASSSDGRFVGGASGMSRIDVR
ncbi:MAG: hypothetical protein ACKOT0_12325 [bacterium]